MTKIQITTRLITVKESYAEVFNRIEENSNKWIEVTEDTTFVGQMSGKVRKGQRNVKINVNHIIEIYCDERQERERKQNE